MIWISILYFLGCWQTMRRRNLISAYRVIIEICQRYSSTTLRKFTYAHFIRQWERYSIDFILFMNVVLKIHRCLKYCGKILCKNVHVFFFFTADWRIESKQKSLFRGALSRLGTRLYTTFPLWHALFYGGLCFKLDDTCGKYFILWKLYMVRQNIT